MAPGAARAEQSLHDMQEVMNSELRLLSSDLNHQKASSGQLAKQKPSMQPSVDKLLQQADDMCSQPDAADTKAKQDQALAALAARMQKKGSTLPPELQAAAMRAISQFTGEDAMNVSLPSPNPAMTDTHTEPSTVSAKDDLDINSWMDDIVLDAADLDDMHFPGLHCNPDSPMHF
eukprot:scaffold83970_cov35-Prasinocladus_malaysianus.AAC.3